MRAKIRKTLGSPTLRIDVLYTSTIASMAEAIFEQLAEGLAKE
jgi:hypothetical protein